MNFIKTIIAWVSTIVLILVIISLCLGIGLMMVYLINRFVQLTEPVAWVLFGIIEITVAFVVVECYKEEKKK